MTVRTWGDEEISVIEGRGYVAGEVSAVANDGMMHDRQRVDVWLRPGSHSGVQHARWILQPFAKPVRRGDLICVLHGATAATILRPHSDYCAVIATSVNPIGHDNHQPKINNARFTDFVGSAPNFPHDLLLVWDWKMSGTDPKAETREYASLIRKRLPRHADTELQNRVDELIRAKRVEDMLEDLNAWRSRREQDQSKGAEHPDDAELWRARYYEVWNPVSYSGPQANVDGRQYQPKRRREDRSRQRTGYCTLCSWVVFLNTIPRSGSQARKHEASFLEVVQGFRVPYSP
jgi:hypothetical protein